MTETLFFRLRKEESSNPGCPNGCVTTREEVPVSGLLV